MGCPLKRSCNYVETLPVGTARYSQTHFFCSTSKNWKNCPVCDYVSDETSFSSGDVYTPISRDRKIILLCFFLGWLGVHRFYVGKKISGLLYAISGGFGGLGVAIDMALIAAGKFDDSMEKITKGEKIFCWTMSIIAAIQLLWIGYFIIENLIK